MLTKEHQQRLKEIREQSKANVLLWGQSDENIKFLLSLIDTLESEKAKADEVIHCAQAILTGLNIRDLQKDSPLHLKLREVMIQYRKDTQ